MTRTDVRGIGAVCIALVIAALTVPAYWLYLLTAVALSAMVARSVGLVTGQAGQITLCQMSFAAVGGWLVSWMSLEWGWLPFPLMVLAAGAVVSLIGAALGLASLRIRGVELAAVTLGLASALSLVLGRLSFPGTAQGIPVVPNGPFSDGYWFYALAWSALLGTHLLITIVGRSRVGIAWQSIRISERATAALGGRPEVAKATSFMVGAGVAGIAGGLLAGQYGLLTEEVFSPITSMVYFAVAVMTGASVLGGAVLAGVLLVFVPEALRRVGIPVDVADALFALGAFEILRKGNGGIAEQ
ncbi:branched-chain amino acid ABC transporter permease, partial [Georgenia sp. 10Sc9-8]|nr:branched-chain amino acid ABC transporter permease [Georgenia halotolerans]